MAVKLDIIEGARIVERAGEIIELDRIADVTGITTHDSGTLHDFLTAVGVPEAGDAHPDDASLILEDRSLVRAFGNGQGARIILTYRQHITVANWRAEGTASIEYRPKYTTGGAPGTGTQITVTHGGVTQSASIQSASPIEDLSIEVVESEDDFEFTGFQGKISSATWLGYPAGTWLCSRFEYRPAILSVSPRLWRNRYTFQYRADGWQPIVAWIDPSTNRPPPGLVVGTGLKIIPDFGTLDFNTKFS